MVDSHRLYITKDKMITYLKFPETEPECQIHKVFIKLWPGTEATEERDLFLHRTLESWDVDTLTWNTRPQMSEPLLSFKLENGTIFTNVEVTDLYQEDPSFVGGFALSGVNADITTKLYNKDRFVSRIVFYCQQ